MKEKTLNIGSVSIKFQINDSTGTLTCVVSGQLETSNSPGFLEAVKDESKKEPIKKIVMELSGLTYVSSTGIGSFTSLLVECKKLGITLILKNINPKVKSVFDLLGFSSFFNME